MPELVERFTAAAKRGCTIPVLAKLTPNVAAMSPAAEAAKRGGTDGIAAINTIKSIMGIALETGVPENTVKSYFRRSSVAPSPQPEKVDKTVEVDEAENEERETKPCRFCGQPVPQNPGRKEKKFCCPECRNRWWNKNKYRVPRKTLHTFLCPTCGEEFSAYGTSGRKYCSHSCYISGRFHGGAK